MCLFSCRLNNYCIGSGNNWSDYVPLLNLRAQIVNSGFLTCWLSSVSSTGILNSISCGHHSGDKPFFSAIPFFTHFNKNGENFTSSSRFIDWSDVNFPFVNNNGSLNSIVSMFLQQLIFNTTLQFNVSKENEFFNSNLHLSQKLALYVFKFQRSFRSFQFFSGVALVFLGTSLTWLIVSVILFLVWV